MNQLISCPGCKRKLLPTLSICPSCGIMINDSVREELYSKIIPIPKKNVDPPVSTNSPKITIANSVEDKKDGKVDTTRINSKSTDPTLIEFNNQGPQLADWQIRLKMKVQERLNRNQPSRNLESSFSRAPDYSNSEVNKNELLLRALQRIEKSKTVFNEVNETTQEVTENSKEHPFYTKRADPSITTTSPQIESIGDKQPIEKFKTNKLPNISEFLDKVEQINIESEQGESAMDSNKPTEQNLGDDISADVNGNPQLGEVAEYWDYAPLSQRFIASLVDICISFVLSLILLLPFMSTSSDQLFNEWIIAIAITTLIVMFIYLTTALTFFGKTIGMRFFLLEVVDIDDNDYPTLHQALTSTTIYLISLLILGLGFLPAFFNEERRTLHDLMSGTIVIKEIRQK
jgi:uncharacterized RDD family membrane protein YckC